MASALEQFVNSVRQLSAQGDRRVRTAGGVERGAAASAARRAPCVRGERVGARVSRGFILGGGWALRCGALTLRACRELSLWLR